MANDNWYQERARLHHDWLTVSFLTFVQAWQVELDRAGEGSALPDEVSSQLKHWTHHKPRLDALLAGAAKALGPGSTSVLAGLPPQEVEAAIATVHRMWLEQSGTGGLIARLQGAVSDADALVNGLLAQRLVPSAGRRLYECCVTVSRGLSALRPAGSGA